MDEVLFRTHVPKQFSAPNLPELNRSQVHAVRHALQRPLSLIQGKNLNSQKKAGIRVPKGQIMSECIL